MLARTIGLAQSSNEREGFMAPERIELPSQRSRRLASEKEVSRFRCASNLALARDTLAAALLLAGLGVVLSLLSAGLDLGALR